MTYEVRTTTQADSDAHTIWKWLVERSLEGASRWVDAFESAKNRLAAEAGQLGLADESDAFDEDLRQVLFKTRKGNTYRLLYVIRGEVVFVVAVRGAGQDMVTPTDLDMPKP